MAATWLTFLPANWKKEFAVVETFRLFLAEEPNQCLAPPTFAPFERFNRTLNRLVENIGVDVAG